MKTFIWIIVALLILAGGWWYFSMPAASTEPTPTPATTDTTPNPATTTDNATTSTTTTTGAPMTANVMYGAQGFSPATVTIAKGGTVTWTNQSGTSMWVASDEHPSHTGYAGTTRQEHCPDASGAAFDQCAPGSTYSFTFNKTGSWDYHDHTNASRSGTVIVQ